MAHLHSQNGKIIPRWRIGVLGLITIAVYGTWYYAFGVLLDPIISDTGWSESALTGAFGLSILVGGVASLAGGWLLDRFGSRITFAIAAVVALTLFQVAAGAPSLQLFAVTAILGGGLISALGMYHITQTVAVRISPGATTRAIAVLTIWGAFASAIYVPLTGWMVGPMGWRLTLRLISASAALVLAIGAVAIDVKVAASRDVGIWRGLGTSLRSKAARRFVLAVGLVGIGGATLLVYQVPAMTAAGLPLGVASFWAGARGFAQLGGRLPLMPIVARLGVSGSFRLAIVAISAGMVILAFAGTPLLAAVFAVVAGFGIGALSPLQGMQSHQLFGESSLGTAMGLTSFVFLVMGAAGPAMAGVVAEASGSRAVPVLAAAAVTLAGVFVTPSTREA
ncbi:MAG TPA: MFS transporter [Acidimicrobiia bacterium]|nr:MFS transporter [Acidimicrobiia bacterium]